MKKTWTRVLAGFLSCALLAGTTACSTDKSWAAKENDTTVSIGSYIYYLFTGYNTAESQKKDANKPVLEQQIEGKKAETWIRNSADESMKDLFYINDQLKKMNIKLTEADNKQIDSIVDFNWKKYGPMFENIGIAKSSFKQAYAEFSVKRNKLFEATYDAKGPKAVSDDALRSYYEKNYTDFSYFIKPLAQVGKDGKAKDFSEAEKAKAKTELEGYASKIQNKKLTIQQAADEFKKSINAKEDILQNSTLNFAQSTGYPLEIPTKLKGMKPGDVTVIEIPKIKVMMLLQKNDITAKSQDVIKSKNQRLNLLYECKGEEFFKDMKAGAAKIKNIQYNEKAMNSCKISDFPEKIKKATAEQQKQQAQQQAPATSDKSDDNKKSK